MDRYGESTVSVALEFNHILRVLVNEIVKCNSARYQLAFKLQTRHTVKILNHLNQKLIFIGIAWSCIPQHVKLLSGQKH